MAGLEDIKHVHSNDDKQLGQITDSDSLAERENTLEAPTEKEQQRVSQTEHRSQAVNAQNHDTQTFLAELELQINLLRVLSAERGNLLSKEQEQQQQLLQFLGNRNKLFIEQRNKVRDDVLAREAAARIKREYELQIDQLHNTVIDQQMQLRQLREVSEENEKKFRRELKDCRKQIVLKDVQLLEAEKQIEIKHTIITEKDLELNRLSESLIESNSQFQTHLRSVETCNKKSLEFEKELGGYQKQIIEKDEQLQTAETRNKEADDQLDQLNTKLRDSEGLRNIIDKENKQLLTDLHLCRSELQTYKELAYTTKIRQLRQVKMSEEVESLISHLEVALVDMRKQNAASNSESVNGGQEKLSNNCPLPHHLNRLQEIYKPLTEMLEAKKVAALMFQYDALAIKELQAVQCSRTPIKAAQHLLKVILNIPEQRVYNCFLDALKELGHHDIWWWLLYPDYNIGSAHVKLIQIHYTFLVDKIDARTGLIGELYSREVIDRRDCEDLGATSSSSEWNEKLLSMLGRRSEQQFEYFMGVLRQTDHSHVFCKLRGIEVVSSPVLTNPESKSPTLKHVIPSDGRRVVGLTSINNELFVLRHPSEEEIQVYETSTFTQQRTLRVAGLNDHGWWSRYRTLTSCDVNNCLFVCDRWNVYKVDLSTDNVINWRVDGLPTGLSVNDARHVIVTCYHDNEIREYKPNGRFVRKIKPQKSHVTRPFHSVQLTDSQFIVSHQGPVNGVSLIDTRGSVISTYRNSESTELLNWPKQVTIAENGSVLVADCSNNRLVVLDASLRNARVLTLPIDGGLSRPQCLYFNESLGRLYVGESNGKRVVIFENINTSNE